MRKRTSPKASPQQPAAQQPIAQPSVIPPELLQAACQTAFEPKPRKTHRCRVCGADGATEQSEMLCWVCRRLKISAWRDNEQQLPANE